MQEKKVLLLEGIHQSAVENFQRHGFLVDQIRSGLNSDELKEKIKDYQVVGIRSRTSIDLEVLRSANHLLAIGCFCIGTNQVDLDAAKIQGVPVFNAPYSNTRSVAELVICEIVMLFRQMCERQIDMHQAVWSKTSVGNFEIRGKKLGIIGYGHIGSQVGILAEFMGMDVYYYDIENKLPLGNAKSVELSDLLSRSDVVTLHVPADQSTKNMLNAHLIDQMKSGSYLINASRGNVVVIDDFIRALDKGHLSGGALDVFPKEPKSNHQPFDSPLMSYKNVILTPHIGGSTEESQFGIGMEVSQKLIDFLDHGILDFPVNFPNINFPKIKEGRERYLHVHLNLPGILKEINDIFLQRNMNILSQHLNTDSKIGYVVTDITKNNSEFSLHTLNNLLQVKSTLSCRVVNFLK